MAAGTGPESVLAVDLGKTGCRAGLWRSGVCTTATGAGAPGLAAPDGLPRALAAIREVVAPLLRAAGSAPVDRVGVGAAGALAAPEAAQALADRLLEDTAAIGVVVASDVVAAHAGALAGGPGVVLCAGTGAVALAVAPDGAVTRADGWGPWLGDEGGGAWIGLRGLRAALRAAEGSGPPTRLLDAAEVRFGPIGSLPARMEGSGHPPRLAAGFAADVAAAAAAGDRVAAELLARAAAALAGTVRAAARSWPEGVVARLAVTGGLLELGASLTGPLRDALERACPAMQPVAAPGTPLDGARLLALRADTPHEPSLRRAAARTAPPF